MTTRIESFEQLKQKYEEYKSLVEVRADLDYDGDQNSSWFVVVQVVSLQRVCKLLRTSIISSKNMVFKTKSVPAFPAVSVFVKKDPSSKSSPPKTSFMCK